VRACIAMSYQGLDDESQRLFRLLGLLAASDTPAWLAGVLLECPLDQARARLEALVDGQLLAANTDALGQVRYRFHDLVRLYARERAELEETDERRSSALVRGLGAWLAVAERMAVGVPGPCFAAIHGSATRPAVDWAQADLLRVDPLAWFDAERGSLLSAVRQACELGLDELAFGLASTLEKYFDIRGMTVDWAATNTHVLQVCQAAGNRLGEAVMLRGLLDVLTWNTSEPHGEAMARLQADSLRLLSMFGELGNTCGMADAAVACSWGMTAQGAYADALAMGVRALDLAKSAGHLGGQARAHVALALANGEQRKVDLSLAHLTRALALARESGNSRFEATVLQFLGMAYRELDDPGASRRALHDSLAISRRYKDHYAETLTMLEVARLHLRYGDPGARAAAETSLRLGRRYNMGHHVADALKVLGDVELAAGHRDRAVERLTESVCLWRTRGWPSFLAAALRSLGHAQVHSDPAAAQAAWTEAQDIFAKLGNEAEAGALRQLAAGHADGQ